METVMAAVSSEVAKESQREAVSEMGLLSTEPEVEDFVTIDIPPIVSPAPETVSFLGSASAANELGSSSRTKSKFEYQTGTLTMEEVAVLALGEKSHFVKPALAINRATTLPAIPFKPLLPNRIGEYRPIYRSHSVPVTNDNVQIFRVVPNRRLTERNNGLLSPSALQNGGDDIDTITEEEAVCRICLEELGEDLNTFKLECNCKGDLALVHRHCSERWFNLRGTRICEICAKRIENISVRVTRRMNTSFWNQFQPPPMTYTDMIWHGILLLFVVSMMFYTLSIQLIRSRRSEVNTDEPYGALSASIVLAFLTSTAAAAFGQWRVVWIHALLQFVVFTISAEFFFDLCRMGPLLTLCLATILAIGIGRGAEPAYRAIRKWMETRVNQVNNNPQDAVAQIEIQVAEERNERHQLDANLHDRNGETEESYQSDANYRESNEETAESQHSDTSNIDSTETDESHHSNANSLESVETAESRHSDASSIESMEKI